jgi:hypothetical protein
MTVRSRVLSVAAAAAAVASLAVVPTVATAAPAAKASQTQRCPSFQVVLNDPAAGFAAGHYFRLNFAPRVSTLTCTDTYHVLRSYLYEPTTLKGWKVGPLIGELRGQQGKHFTKNGSNGKIGFDVFRPVPN